MANRVEDDAEPCIALGFQLVDTGRKPEHQVVRKALGVALYSANELPGLDFVERGDLFIEDHTQSTHLVDEHFDVTYRKHLGIHAHTSAEDVRVGDLPDSNRHRTRRSRRGSPAPP